MKIKRLSRKTISKNPWFNLYQDRIVLPAGRKCTFNFIDYQKEGVGVVIKGKKKQILLIKSYRYTTNSLEWEIPAGSVEKGELKQTTAKREVIEETGYEAGKMRHLYTYNPVNGTTNAVFHVFICQAGRRKGDFDRNEVKEIKWFSEKELKVMIRRKGIKDGFTLSALLLYFSKLYK